MTCRFFEIIPSEIIKFSFNVRSQELLSKTSHFFNKMLHDKTSLLSCYQACFKNPIARGLIEATQIQDKLKTGLIDPQKFLKCIEDADRNTLKKILKTQETIHLLFPSYAKTLNTSFFSSQKICTLYLSQTIAKNLINNYFNVDHLEKVSIQLEKINFDQLLKNGVLKIALKNNIIILSDEKNENMHIGNKR